MRAVTYRLRRAIRPELPGMIVITLVVAVAVMVTLAMAAGAARTASAPDRFARTQGGSHAVEVDQTRGRPLTGQVAKLPGVRSATSITFLFAYLQGRAQGDPNSVVFAGTAPPNGSRVVTGHAPDPTHPGQFVASRSWFEAEDASIGDAFQLHVITQADADRFGFNPAKAKLAPIRAVLVGMVDGPDALDDSTPLAMFPMSLLDGRSIASSTTLMTVRPAPGTTPARLRAELDGLPGGRALATRPTSPVSATVRTAVDAQQRGLWAVALVGALAAIVVLGQLLSRRFRLSEADQERLSAIGFTHGQIVLDAAGRATVPIVAGVLIGSLLAVLPSGLFPVGFARRIEPHPGLRVDLGVLGLGALVLLVALLAWTVASIALGGRPTRPSRPSALAEQVATLVPSSTAAAGIRLAFNRGRHDTGSVRSAMVGLVLIVAGLVGTITFAVSISRLIDEPSRYGLNYDLEVGSGAPTVPADLRADLDTDPAVAAATLYGPGQAQVAGQTLELVSVQQVRGDITPPLITGRLPAADDEIALGRLAARSLHTHVGGTVELTGSRGRELRYRVTALVVVPSIGLNDGVGQDGVTTLAGLRRLTPTAQADTVALRLRPGQDTTRLRRLAGGDLSVSETSHQLPPASIFNLSRIRAVPSLLAGLLGALATLTLVHELLVAVGNRRRDLAVLRTLGADRRWISRAVLWQSSVLALVPLVIGTPLGLVAGRITFRLFADSIGTIDDAAMPIAICLAGAAIGLALANIIGAFTTRRVRHLALATELHPE